MRTTSMEIRVQEAQLAAIRDALRQTGGNATEAARLLGRTRDNLYWIARRAGVTMEELRHGKR